VSALNDLKVLEGLMAGLNSKPAAQPVVQEQPVATAVAEPVADPVTEPEVVEAAPVEKSAPCLEKYVLYDHNNAEHRDLWRSRVEYGGFYFIKGTITSEKDTENAIQRKLSDGHYPIGIVEKGSGLHEAYFPPLNTIVMEEIAWLGRARSLRQWADYQDAVYAEWDTPQPIAGELKPVLQFNPAWLPDAIRPFVTDVSERVAVPIDFPAVCALVCLSGAVNHRAFVFPLEKDKDFAEPLCASGAVIADSGKKKSPTWKIFMKPLNEWEFDEDALYNQRLAEYEEKRQPIIALRKKVDDLNKEEKKAAKKEKRDPEFVKFDPASEGLTIPIAPVKPRRLVLNDSTSEQMHEIAKTNPQGLFYYRDELSGWAAELDMVGREGSRSMFLQGMTGDHDHNVDRVGREGGHAKMTLSVFGSFQPHLFVNFLSETRNVADGTIPRFNFIVWPDSQRLPIIDRQVNTVAKAQYREVVRRLADLPDKSVSIHLSKDVQPLFHAFRTELRNKVERESNPGKKSHLSKYEGGLAKIAALLQLVDVVAALPQTTKLSKVSLEDGKTETAEVLSPVPTDIYVDMEHWERAVSLLAYLESHMHRVYDSKLEGIEYRKVRLVEHIRDGSLHDGMTANEIWHKDWNGLGRKVTSADSISAALEELAELGWVRKKPIAPGTTMGRPTIRWEVNPLARTASLEYSAAGEGASGAQVSDE
jgi:uncharacterized protein DUF3987